MNHFILNRDTYESIAELDDTSLGRLIRAIAAYSLDGLERNTLTDEIRIIFDLLKRDLIKGKSEAAECQN
jgi:hypothetical protein